MDVVLHIGPHKTGTTALQAHLHAAGLTDPCYPTAGRTTPDGTLTLGHHPLARLLRAQGTERSELEAIASDIRAESDGASVVVLSSEAFVLAGAEGVARTRWFLEQLHPERVRVVAFLRESLTHRVSLFQDKVATYALEHSFPDFLERTPELDLRRLRGLWSTAGTLVLRPYDRTLLAGGDVVSDFAATIGVPLGDPAPGTRDPNPSIGGNLLAVKAILNRVGLGGRSDLRPLRRLARDHARFRGRFRVPPRFSNDVRAASELNRELVLLFPDLTMPDLSTAPVVPDMAGFSEDLTCIADRLALTGSELRAIEGCVAAAGSWFLGDLA